MSEPLETQTQPTCFAEGLDEIFQRNRPSQSQIWLEVLGEIPNGSIISIIGPSGSGKSMFLMQIMAKALVGATLGAVLLIDAERTFNSFHFVDLCSELLGADFDDTTTHQNQIRNQLENLFIVFPTEKTFDAFIASLDAKLSNDPRISMVFIDSIGIFFFSESQELKDSRHEFTLNSYLEKFKQLAKKYKVTVVYTKPCYVEESFDCRNNITIHLAKFTTGNFLMTLRSKEREKEQLFSITSRGIKLFNGSQEITRHSLNQSSIPS